MYNCWLTIQLFRWKSQSCSRNVCNTNDCLSSEVYLPESCTTKQQRTQPGCQLTARLTKTKTPLRVNMHFNSDCWCPSSTNAVLFCLHRVYLCLMWQRVRVLTPGSQQGAEVQRYGCSAVLLRARRDLGSHRQSFRRRAPLMAACSAGFGRLQACVKVSRLLKNHTNLFI